MNSFEAYFDAKILKKYYEPRQEITKKSGFLWWKTKEMHYTIHEWFIDCKLESCDNIVLKISIEEEVFERIDLNKTTISIYLGCKYKFNSICFYDDKKELPTIIEIK